MYALCNLHIEQTEKYLKNQLIWITIYLENRQLLHSASVS
jgi:hypothetical protein